MKKKITATAFGAVAGALSIAMLLPGSPSVGAPDADRSSDTTAMTGLTEAGTSFFTIEGQLDSGERTRIAQSGAAIEFPSDASVMVEATPEEADYLRKEGFDLIPTANPADAANERVKKVQQERTARGEQVTNGRDFPAGDEDFHTYDEVNAEIRQIERRYPGLAKVFSIGRSYEGREIYGIKISDNVDSDENETEVIQTCNIHAREHITTEMCMYMANEFTSQYSRDNRIKNIVDNRVLYLIPMLNPDGSIYDVASGEYQSWRKNRQPGREYMGTDLNRNFAHGWGCCGGSSGNEKSQTYRGRYAESGPEVKALADFVRDRNRGKKRINAHIDWHSYSELVLWPFGKTDKQVVPGMTRDEYRVFETLGRKMADSNRYKPEQSSDLYITDGDSSDWFWGDMKIWSYTMEMFPKGRNPGFYPDDSVIPRETRRNREAVLTFLEAADCPERVIGQEFKCKGNDVGPTDSPTTPIDTPTTPVDSPTTPVDSPTTPIDGGGSSFFNNDRQDIRDYGTVKSDIRSTYRGAQKVKVELDVNHSCSQNLEIAITTPDGVRNVVKRSSYAYRCDVWRGVRSETYPLRSKSDGTWTLEISDNRRGDTGTLNGWGVSFS